MQDLQRRSLRWGLGACLAWTAACNAGTGDFKVLPDIYGGRPANGSWSGMAAVLRSGDPDNVTAQYCGATLIGPQHALTAAQCVYMAEPAGLDVLVGTDNLASGGKRVAVLNITVHPQWSESTGSYDVAVLKLVQPVRFKATPFISTLEEEERLAAPDTNAVVAGWGLTADGTNPSQLQKLRQRIVARSSCADMWADWMRIDEQQLCAGSGRSDRTVDYGDRGGPLWVRDPSTGTRVQVGVVSQSMMNEMGIYFPDVYSRLATLGNWVRQQMK